MESGTIKGLNDCNKPIYYNDTYFMNSAYAIFCNTEEAVREFKARAEREGISSKGVDKCGVAYIWNGMDFSY